MKYDVCMNKKEGNCKMKSSFCSVRGYKGKGVSQITMCHGYGHISGQISCDIQTGRAIHDSMSEQTERVLKCLEGILEDLGLSLDNIVKCNVFISSMDSFDDMNKVYLQFFGDECPPARQTVVAGIWDDLDVEISAEFVY